MSSTSANLTVRPVNPQNTAEVTFIINSWVELSKYKDYTYLKVHPDYLESRLRARIARLLSISNCCILLSEAGTLLGACCYTYDRETLWPVIHYIYQTEKSHNFMSKLVEAAGGTGKSIWVTSQVAHRSLRAVKYTTPFYNPFLLDYDPREPR